MNPRGLETCTRRRKNLNYNTREFCLYYSITYEFLAKLFSICVVFYLTYMIGLRFYVCLFILSTNTLLPIYFYTVCRTSHWYSTFEAVGVWKHYCIRYLHPLRIWSQFFYPPILQFTVIQGSECRPPSRKPVSQLAKLFLDGAEHLSWNIGGITLNTVVVDCSAFYLLLIPLVMMSGLL